MSTNKPDDTGAFAPLGLGSHPPNGSHPYPPKGNPEGAEKKSSSGGEGKSAETAAAGSEVRQQNDSQDPAPSSGGAAAAEQEASSGGPSDDGAEKQQQGQGGIFGQQGYLAAAGSTVSGAVGSATQAVQDRLPATENENGERTYTGAAVALPSAAIEKVKSAAGYGSDNANNSDGAADASAGGEGEDGSHSKVAAKRENTEAIPTAGEKKEDAGVSSADGQPTEQVKDNTAKNTGGATGGPGSSSDPSGGDDSSKPGAKEKLAEKKEQIAEKKEKLSEKIKKRLSFRKKDSPSS